MQFQEAEIKCSSIKYINFIKIEILFFAKAFMNTEQFFRNKG